MSTSSTTAQRDRAASSAADRRRDFELYDQQYDFVYDDEHKYTAFIGGIGSGKSFAGAGKALRRAVEAPGSLGVIGAPNYPQLRDSTMRTVFDVFPPALIADYHKTDRLLTLVNGSEILFKSMDNPDNLRGPNLGWFWLDEGPLCGYYAWKVMKGRLRQGRAQQGFVTGTPHGEDEFYEDFEQEIRPGHKLYRASTRDNLHNLPPTYIEDLGYDGQFALQEIEGLFVNFEGLVYEFRREWHVDEWLKSPDANGHPRRAAHRIGGVDWGYTNPSVALPIWVDGDDRAYVLDEYYARQTGYEGVAQACCDFTRQHRIEVWYCGPDEPEHIASLNKRFATERLDAKAVPADDDINAGLKTVRALMKRRGDDTVGLMISASCAMTKAEFRTYSYPPHSDNAAKRDPDEKPLKKNDHAMDALRYALHSRLGTMHRRQPVTPVTVEALQSKLTISGVAGGTGVMSRKW